MAASDRLVTSLSLFSLSVNSIDVNDGESSFSYLGNFGNFSPYNTNSPLNKYEEKDREKRKLSQSHFNRKKKSDAKLALDKDYPENSV